MTVKNLFLGFVAVILTVCLIGLLILATNEDALAKVHKTINTLNAINVSTEDTYKKKILIKRKWIFSIFILLKHLK